MLFLGAVAAWSPNFEVRIFIFIFLKIKVISIPNHPSDDSDTTNKNLIIFFVFFSFSLLPIFDFLETFPTQIAQVCFWPLTLDKNLGLIVLF